MSRVRFRIVKVFMVERDDVGERICDPGGDVAGQPGLAPATGASEGDMADVWMQQEGSRGR
jgi:hypothetical protein